MQADQHSRKIELEKRRVAELVRLDADGTEALLSSSDSSFSTLPRVVRTADSSLPMDGRSHTWRRADAALSTRPVAPQDRAIAVMQGKIEEQRRKMGGVNAAKENNQQARVI